jgi:hypothetical protein
VDRLGEQNVGSSGPYKFPTIGLSFYTNYKQNIVLLELKKAYELFIFSPGVRLDTNEKFIRTTHRLSAK